MRKTSQKRLMGELEKLEIERKGMVADLRKRNHAIVDRFINEIMPRVGTTAIDKLEWVLKVLSHPPHTPDDWENLQLEIAIFCGEHSAIYGHANAPTKEEASQITCGCVSTKLTWKTERSFHGVLEIDRSVKMECPLIGINTQLPRIRATGGESHRTTP